MSLLTFERSRSTFKVVYVKNEAPSTAIQNGDIESSTSWSSTLHRRRRRRRRPVSEHSGISPQHRQRHVNYLGRAIAVGVLFIFFIASTQWVRSDLSSTWQFNILNILFVWRIQFGPNSGPNSVFVFGHIIRQKYTEYQELKTRKRL